MADPHKLRTPLAITLSVWKALFMRQTLSRIAQDRIAWAWLIVEPLLHIGFLMWLYAVGIRSRVIAGADTGVFILLGLQSLFMLRNVWARGMAAVDANERLYAFRQIKPIDTVIMSAVSEGVLVCVIFLGFFLGAGLLDHPVVPADPLGALVAGVGLWLLGLGLALVFSVIASLFPEVGRITRLMMLPLYFASAVIYPSISMPHAILEVLLWNPVLHGIEALRVAFMPTYIIPSGITLTYVYSVALGLIFAGLVLHVRYRTRLMTTL